MGVSTKIYGYWKNWMDYFMETLIENVWPGAIPISGNLHMIANYLLRIRGMSYQVASSGMAEVKHCILDMLDCWSWAELTWTHSISWALAMVIMMILATIWGPRFRYDYGLSDLYIYIYMYISIVHQVYKAIPYMGVPFCTPRVGWLKVGKSILGKLQ